MANYDLQEADLRTIWDGLGCFRLLDVPLLFPAWFRWHPRCLCLQLGRSRRSSADFLIPLVDANGDPRPVGARSCYSKACVPVAAKRTIFKGAISMSDRDLERHPFQVLRVVLQTPPGVEEVVIAKVDLIDVDHDLLLFDCELHVVDDFGEVGEVYVKVPDLRVLLRYFLEPGFCGEIDFSELLNEMNHALCVYFGLSGHTAETSCDALYEFVRSPQWRRWLRDHHAVPSEKQAVLDFVAARRDPDRRARRSTGLCCPNSGPGCLLSGPAGLSRN
jgi:hypothetical protein